MAAKRRPEWEWETPRGHNFRGNPILCGLYTQSTGFSKQRYKKAFHDSGWERWRALIDIYDIHPEPSAWQKPTLYHTNKAYIIVDYS